MRDGAIARVNDGVYYLSMGLWAGAIAMLAVAAPGSFAALRGAEPPTPRADELAGLVVNRMVEGLLTLTLICAGLVLVSLVLQMLWRPGARRPGGWNAVRVGLIVAATAVLATVAWGVVPTMNQQRQAMYDPARSEPQRASSRDAFDRSHQLAERLIGANGVAVAAALLISPLALTIESKDQGAEYG